MKRLIQLIVFGVGVAVCAGVVVRPTPLMAWEAPRETFIPPVAASNNGFATGLYGQLAKQNPDGNLFFSPYSIYGALLRAAEGLGEKRSPRWPAATFTSSFRNSNSKPITR